MTNQYLSRRRPAKCPRCGKKSIARIIYGLPLMTDQLNRDLSDGKVILGGCSQEADDPAWKCTECNTNIYINNIAS